MHARYMRRVPRVYHLLQNNTAVKLANEAAREAAVATGTAYLNLYNVTNNAELLTDTLDGTHTGWRGNAVKVDRIVRAIVNSDFHSHADKTV